MSRAIAVVFVWLALLGGVVPARAESPRSQPRAEMARLTTVVGDSSASIPVRVPTDTTLDMDAKSHRSDGPNADIHISGRGRFVGIVLVPDPYEPGSEPPWPIVAGRFARCDEPACSARRFFNRTSNVLGDDVPAGDYRLHLIADGAPVTVTLNFGDELGGRVTLRPRAKSPIDLQTPPQSITNDERYLWSAGSAYDAGRVGISLSATWVTLDDSSRGFDMGVCQIQYPAPPPEQIYGPQCNAVSLATGAGVLWGERVPRRDDQLILSALFGYHDQGIGPESLDGRFGWGAWFLSHGVPIKGVVNTTWFLQTADTWD